MFIWLLLVFIALPALELYVLLEAGRLIGALPTLALVLLTGIAGATLARSQGFELLRRLQQELAQGTLPANDLVDGLMILLGGMMLLTPGFITDLAGFACLMPLSRGWLKRKGLAWLERQLQGGRVRIYRG